MTEFEARLRGERLTVQLSHLGRASLCTPAAPIAGIAGCRPG